MADYPDPRCLYPSLMSFRVPQALASRIRSRKQDIRNRRLCGTRAKDLDTRDQASSNRNVVKGRDRKEKALTGRGGLEATEFQRAAGQKVLPSPSPVCRTGVCS